MTSLPGNGRLPRSTSIESLDPPSSSLSRQGGGADGSGIAAAWYTTTALFLMGKRGEVELTSWRPAFVRWPLEGEGAWVSAGENVATSASRAKMKGRCETVNSHLVVRHLVHAIDELARRRQTGHAWSRQRLRRAW